MALSGRIHKGIGGFYYVETADGLYECKARGAFRKQKITPLVGDLVEITVHPQGENTIDAILPRKNELRRPPLANIDRLFIVSSLTDPEIRTVQIDKLTVLAAQKNIECVVVLTKADLAENGEQYAAIYKKAGFPVILCNARTGAGADELPSLIKGKLCAFTGNSGVGKSTLLNDLCPDLALETGETSKKLGRGRHTTRHCELYPVAGGWVADTPGFSALELERDAVIDKDELADCFLDFRPYLGQCRFNSCTHIADKGCAVCDAVARGEILESRHLSYVEFYNQVKDIKKWKRK